MLPVKLEIINLGKVEREYRGITGEYERRISSLAHVRYISRGRIPKEAIILDERGILMSSEEFYELLNRASKNGEKLIFVIGPPQGLSEEEKRGKTLISLSKLTLRHELAYLILLEQIYRALLKMKGTSYER
ncbi:MAG: 23S rRNA (pseudouridine(1915)-N(3))-methyltransferase RlmH [Thermoplasmata archaeon]|nr:23S rRNA (pseudouridine(1915)-N(3))-methyltransferase RlmH [Thermoplasmata archaeon]